MLNNIEIVEKCGICDIIYTLRAVHDGGDLMGNRTYEDVKKYVEWQSQHKCKVLSAKPEQKFNDLGTEVTVWNVKTDTDGAWWVVEGDTVPMNLYPQDAYYFGTDEVYSFHMGIMQRMSSAQAEYDPDDYIEAATLGAEIAPQILRKLRGIASLIDSATEIEDFQAIGVQCREILIELGNHVYAPHMAGDSEQPQGSNFKKKTELSIQFYLKGSENADYRSIIKKLTEATWDYANKLTHSSSATYYEASTCVSLCISLVGTYENVLQKIHDPISQCSCSVCKSKKLSVQDVETEDDGIIKSLQLLCNECGNSDVIEFSPTFNTQKADGK